jgi:hypothetical protein
MPAATSTLSTIMTVVVNTTVDLATTVFTTYWPYILVIGVLSALIVWFKRLVFVGAH